MILTEEQARTKWCPFVRFHGTPSDDSISNRHGWFDNDNPGMSRCIGSVCMAWRMKLSPATERKAEAEFRKGGQRIGEAEGYCGLAGTP